MRSIREIDEGAGYVGFRKAFERICSSLGPLGPEEISLGSSIGRIAAEEVFALTSYPSVDISLKDGFAVIPTDVAEATATRSISLQIIGSAFAGSDFRGHVESGSTVKVCSGATIPSGAGSVVASEFCEEISEHEVRIHANADEGRNILRAGMEVEAGTVIIQGGDHFSPAAMGLAAAAGISKVRVFRRPRAAIIAIGDEIVTPGKELRPGQVYASNLITLGAWLHSFDIECLTSVVRDNVDAIRSDLLKRRNETDVILTSGGAWGSERDLVVGVLDDLGWRKIFHHVRMGPGKGIAFGLWNTVPVFCLPGGPASNEMAFLQLALPGILRMAGDTRPPLPTIHAALTEDVRSRHPAWTEFKDALLSRNPDGSFAVCVYRNRSRLYAIAGANSLLCVPEGRECLAPEP